MGIKTEMKLLKFTLLFTLRSDIFIFYIVLLMFRTKINRMIQMHGSIWGQCFIFCIEKAVIPNYLLAQRNMTVPQL